MRIGMILDTSFPPDYRVENEAHQLIKGGHEVYLFSLSKQITKSNENVSGIKVFRYKKSAFMNKMSALAYTIPVYHWLVKPKIKHFLLNYHLDALHVHDMVIAKAVFDVNQKFKKLPIVLDLHENRPAIMELYQHVNTFPGNLLISLKKWQKVQGQLMKRADRIILVTPEAKKVAIKDYNLNKDNIFVIPNSITPEIFCKFKIDDDIVNRFKNRFNLLYLGSTAIRRGLDTAIQAVEILSKQIPEMQLVIVGDSSDDLLLKKMVKNSKLENYIKFEGWQDYSLFPSYLQSADICISPLKRNLHHDTTYANKLFQYMIMEKPLIVSDCPSQENLVKRVGSGVSFTADNTSDLVEKILFLYNRPKLRSVMGKRGKKFVLNEFSWNNFKTDLMEIYNSFHL